MQVTGDLALSVLDRLMAERQRTDLEHRKESSANAFGWIRIVIAGDPDPVTAALQPAQRGAVGVGEAGRTAAVVEAVAQGHNDSWRITRDQRGKPRQRRRGIIGGQQDAAGGEARSLLEMQVRHRKQTFLRPIDDACRVGGEFVGRQSDTNGWRVLVAPLGTG